MIGVPTPINSIRWFTVSNRRVGAPPDGVNRSGDTNHGDTRGVLGFGKRTGPSCFRSQYQTGSGTAAHFKSTDIPPTISGYSGHIAGKYAGNIVGGTYDKTNDAAIEHLKTCEQNLRFGN